MPDKTLNLVNDIVINAENRGVARLVIQNNYANGNKIVLDGKELISFGSYSYLGLETDSRLKRAAIEGIQNFGLQYPSSRVYTSLPVYGELELMFEQIFGAPVVLTTSLSLGHAGVLPVIIEKEDALILDQHVHSSVQDAAQRLKAKSIHLQIVRHNDLEAVERMINELSKKYKRVWYAIDSIYSMYGDVAPLKELYQLVQKYSRFHLYIDDAHGVSSYGKNGAGWVLDQIQLHDRIILTTGMAKAFGTMGGVFVIKDSKLHERVKNCTGSLIFSGGHPVPVLSASIASARIHLSDEIISRQNALADKIYYCHRLLKENGIPDVSDPRTPIFFIALGLLKVGYNMVKRMIDDGFYVNLASFPAVSESCTGIRFTITLNHTRKDIEKLVQTIAKNYPLALNEENVSTNDVRKAFRKVPSFPKDIIDVKKKVNTESLKLNYSRSISSFDYLNWNKRYEESPLMSASFLKKLESIFDNHSLPENNWKFHYFEILDPNKHVVLSTFFTQVWAKEDLLSPKHVSSKIEAQRTTDKYLFTAEVLLMGTLVTEGNHLKIDYNHPDWKSALSLLLNTLEDIKDKENINSVVLRDFPQNDELFSHLRDDSYLKVELPDAHRILNFDWNDISEFMGGFRKHRRSYLKKTVFAREETFDITIEENPCSEQVSIYWELYKNVNTKSLEINNFELPKKFFLEVLKSDDWEVLELRLKNSTQLIAMMLCHKSESTYTPLFIGMDYDYLDTNSYPQMLWQTIKRGKSLGRNEIPLGFTASQIKRKFGATTEPKFGFVKMKDNFSLQQLNLYQ